MLEDDESRVLVAAARAERDAAKQNAADDPELSLVRQASKPHPDSAPAARVRRRACLGAGAAIGLLVLVLILVGVLSSRNSDSELGPPNEAPDEAHDHQPPSVDASNATDNELDALVEYSDAKFEYTFNCNSTELSELIPDTKEYDVRMADCGTGYDFAHSRSKTEHIKVVLWGEAMSHAGMVSLSGCPIGNSCGPLHPKCFFELGTHRSQLKSADVVVVSTFDADGIASLAPRRPHHGNATRPYRVLYWREAYWPAASKTLQAEFDFSMGIHYFSGVVNPVYLRRPHMMLSQSVFKFLPFEERKHFAMSIISDCHASSQRQYYIDHLVAYLGHDRVHQYGRCGTRSLPPPPITNAAKTIEKYKFFLAFENTIMPGYVTEKLFTVLNMGVIPIYLGTPDAPNITTTPSYIRVTDFASPKKLAEYLLYLDENPKEYMKYHAWRNSANSFDPAYLDIVARQMPGQDELHAYRGHGYPKYSRRAACCRLCDENMLERAKNEHVPANFVGPKWHPDQVNHHLFQGKMQHIPPNALLKP